MPDKEVTVRYLLAIIAVVIFTWFIHEFAHWLTGELLGYKTIMRLNGTSLVPGQRPTGLDKIIISASGPIITILQGLIIFLVLKFRDWNKYFYIFLFTAFYMRCLAGIMNLIKINDEGRVSEFLEIGTFTLPMIVSGVLFFMVYRISSKYKLNWKFQLATTLLVMAASSLVILSDKFFRLRIL